MQLKQFYTNHKRLLKVLLGVFLMAILGIYFALAYVWSQSTSTVCESLAPKTEMAVALAATTSTPPAIQSPVPTPEPVVAPRYGFTDDEIYLMAVLLTGSKNVDGDGEFDFDYGRQTEYDQMSLVLCVVMNRVRSTVYPNTVSEVIWQKGQFSYMPHWKHKLPQVSDISLQRVTEWCKAYDAYDIGVQTIPEDHLYFSGDGRRNHSR